MAIVTTGYAAGITQDSAVIVGNAFSGFMGAIDFVAVQYDTHPDMISPVTVHGMACSPFSVELTELQPDTVYYYRAVVCTSGGKCCFGVVRSFVTPLPVPAPIVVTGDAINVTTNAAFIANNMFSDIPGTVEQVAVQYNTSPTLTGAAEVQGTLGSPFSVPLSGLQPNTTYYYRAVVSATSGTYYGEVKSFTTQAAAAVVITGDATNISPSSATIINNQYSGISGTIIYVAVQYSTSPSMTSATTRQGTIGSPFSVNLTTLQPNTTYYFRAAVSTSSGQLFGAIKSFTTPAMA